MGYLFCGPVGTGKSFLATCVAGAIGVPAVVLKNFRTKYVGETEGNLERVLGVLRAMGPVVVDRRRGRRGARRPRPGRRLRRRPRLRHDRRADGRHALPRQDHLDAADRAAGSAADRSQAPGPRRGPHPAVLSDRGRGDPHDVHDPREEARARRSPRPTCPPRSRTRATCRAPTSRASSAARGARRCCRARTITKEALAGGARRLHAVDADARARAAGARGDHRVHRRRVPAAERRSRRWTSSAAARSCRSG